MFAFLDIETSWQQSITVIGVYRPGVGTRQLVAPRITRDALLELVDGVEIVFTYNGGRFDLPVIAAHVGVDLARRHAHRDLMFDCWKHDLKGGLKKVEQRLGIHRDTEGVDGLQAMNLWANHRRHLRIAPPPRPLAEDFPSRLPADACCEALEFLLRYNREDCENLEILAQKLGVFDALRAAADGR